MLENKGETMKTQKTRIPLLALIALGAVGVASAQLINGAGATFPAPIYTKWFS
jgi:ABC-type phosphate transport system substrate-binding protein